MSIYTKDTINFPTSSFEIPSSIQQSDINNHVYEWQQGWKTGWNTEFNSVPLYKDIIPSEYHDMPIINTKYRRWPNPPECVYTFDTSNKVGNNDCTNFQSAISMGRKMGSDAFNEYKRYILK